MSDEAPRSRRSILLAAAGTAAAATAVAIGRPSAALAADGDPVLLGADNHSDSITALTRDSINSPGDATLFVQNTISAAVVGHATSGQGVIGRSQTSAGVQGYSQTDAGVNGFGVFGVWATGEAHGLFGTSDGGNGVHGESNTGNGGEFGSSSGNALSTSGRLHFEGVSGVATIAPGRSSVEVTPGTDLTDATFVLLTPRGRLGPRDLWYSIDADADTFVIRLSKPVLHPLDIGWLVLD
jgi:hypothetical protein